MDVSYFKIFELLGGCNYKIYKLSYWKFVYLHPPSKFKIYSMTDDTRYSTTENLIIANGWSKVKSGECQRAISECLLHANFTSRNRVAPQNVPNWACNIERTVVNWNSVVWSGYEKKYGLI